MPSTAISFHPLGGSFLTIQTCEDKMEMWIWSYWHVFHNHTFWYPDSQKKWELSILTTGIWQKLWERKTKHWNKSKGNHKLATVFEEFWLNLWPDESLKPGLETRQIFLRILVSESEPRTNCSNHVRTGRMRSVEGSGVSSGVLLPRMGLDATISLEMKPQKPNPDPESENAKRVIKSNMVIDRCIVT